MGLVVGMMTGYQFLRMDICDEQSPGAWFTSPSNDQAAITNWLLHHKYADRRLIPQLHCPLCSPFNYERTIQGVQNRQTATERT